MVPRNSDNSRNDNSSGASIFHGGMCDDHSANLSLKTVLRIPGMFYLQPERVE